MQGKLFIKMSESNYANCPEKELEGSFSSLQALGPCENKQIYVRLFMILYKLPNETT